MHTFATLLKGQRLYGLFEHHTGGITPRDHRRAGLRAARRDARYGALPRDIRWPRRGARSRLSPGRTLHLRRGDGTQPAPGARSRLSRGGPARRHDAGRRLGPRGWSAAARGLVTEGEAVVAWIFVVSPATAPVDRGGVIATRPAVGTATDAVVDSLTNTARPIVGIGRFAVVVVPIAVAFGFGLDPHYPALVRCFPGLRPRADRRPAVPRRRRSDSGSGR